ncbi:MAG: ABC transporter ATP-binding protein [Ktedonobacterales bacterium]
MSLVLRRGNFAVQAAFSVPPGLTALLGPSGAGKSLTLQAIAGLIPAEGNILLNGRALLDTKQRIAAPPRLRRVGYVPQSYALFPHLHVGANVAYGLPRGVTYAERERRVAALLALVHLPGHAARRVESLSGGEAQRVALARALAAQPEALLLDEPLSALDMPTRQAVRTELRAIIQASGIPTLLVTHDLAEARALADRLIALVGGRLVAEGSLAETLARPTTATAARLLGWGNILPVAALAQEDGQEHGRWRVELRGGQLLLLAGAAGNVATAHTLVGSPQSVRLALHADRLAIQRGESTNDDTTADTLPGALCGVVDAGPYYALTVALASEAPEMQLVTLTCSPREWTALGLALGDAVRVSVPAGAARLVADA